MESEKISERLGEWRDAAPDDLQEYFLAFEDFWERKLWHQLTDKLVEFFNLPDSAPSRLPIYHEFVQSFLGKVNQLKLVGIGLSAASQSPGDEARLEFLKKLSNTVNKPESQDAYVYASAALANVYLDLQQPEEARKLLEEAQKILDTFDSVETVVHASFYRVNAEYYRVKVEFAPYYKNSLLYLACINLSDLTPAERESRAYQLCLAALVSDEIYNFGELLLHPILDSLEKSEHAWLRELLFTFNRGDLSAYDVLAGNVAKNPLLEEHKIFLYQKISLAALTEAVFKRASHERAMLFTTIANETKVQPDEIEHLLMKAFSLGLLRGHIDQVRGIADIKWVQPKVLDKKQIESMRMRLKEWDSNVNQLGTWIESVGQDVWAA